MAHLSFSFVMNAQPFKFQHIGVDNGLSQDIVTTIVQDKSGFMWFGTEDGLNVYDGYSTRIFKHIPRDTTSLSSNSISHLVVDSKGRLWVSMATVVDVVDAESRTFRRFSFGEPKGSALPHAVDFCEDSDSGMWIATDIGLYKYGSTGVLLRATFDQSMGAPITAAALGPSGFMLLGSSGGLSLFKISGDTLVLQPTTPAVKAMRGHRVFKILRSIHGDYWVGTLDAGLFHLSADLMSVERFTPQKNNPSSPPDARVLALAEDREGRLWVGTFSALHRYEPATRGFLHIKTGTSEPGALLGERIYSLFVDATGALWIGTYRGGVNRYDPRRQKFRHIAYEPKTPGGLGGKNVFALLESADGALWVGTDEGLFRRPQRTGSFVRYRHNPHDARSLSSNIVQTICQRRNGEIYVGCADGTVNRFHPVEQRFTRYALPVRNQVHVVYETRNGMLMAGTDSQGLFVLDTVRQQFVSWPETPIQGGVWMMYEDSFQSLWMGTWVVPYIIRIDSSKTVVKIHRNEENPGGLQGTFVRAMTEDRRGNLWLGVWSGGLYRYERSTATFTRFPESAGLLNDYVKSIERDDDDRLWIGTERGLTCFDLTAQTFRTYTDQDGLQSNFFYSGSSCKGKDGTLYFGGSNGFNAFHPDSITDITNIPPVVITNFRVLDKPVPVPATSTADHGITLSYDQDFFSFEFVALDYTAPERNQYAYKLEGFDKDWVNAGTRRFASYTHLDPGDYTLRVKGSNGDGIWNEAGASLMISITPPYWMTWWFRGFIIVTMAAGLYGFYRYRLNQVLKVERLRQRIGRDLHDDIGTNLSAIVIASQVIRQQQKASREVLDQIDDIGGIALKTQELMRDIVWMLNPRNDTLKEFVTRMRHEAARLFKTIDYSFSAPERELPEKVSLDFKRNMFLIYKEALNNIVRHAHARNVRISVSIQDNTLKVSLQDDGLGFDPKKTSQGNGLANMNSRAKHIGAALRVLSVPGKGCTLELEARIA